MPEFYSKAFVLKKGYTYAIRGTGTTAYTGPGFPDGACGMEGINALMVRGSIRGATVSMVFANDSSYVEDIFLATGTIYPFRPRVIGITGVNDVIGLG
jgi:hypothetical protein